MSKYDVIYFLTLTMHPCRICEYFMGKNRETQEFLNYAINLCILIVVHVISAKHFPSGYQSEILHAIYVPSKLRNSTGRQPVNPQMWSGRSKPPPANAKYVNCYNF